MSEFGRQNLLKEADDIAEKRSSCTVSWLPLLSSAHAEAFRAACSQELLDIMNHALDIVNQVRDFNVLS